MSQLPQDPASGAARSDRSICELLAGLGFRVRCLGTTATEHKRPEPALDYLRGMGIKPRVETSDASDARPILRFERRGIDYTLLDTGDHDVLSWMPRHDARFNALLAGIVEAERPDITLLFGGLPQERHRRWMLREAGSIIVFSVRNWGYLNPRAFEDIDAVITPSRFVSDRYRAAIGLDSTPLPLPIVEADVVARQREPTFVTFINPTAEKGAAVVARVAEEICTRRDDIHFMVIEARQTAGNIVRFGRHGGFDLRRHNRIMASPGTTSPAAIYAATKVLLVPSVWEEPAGRVGAEAMVNGVPAVVSDRGGLAETCRGGGFVIPLPKWLTPISRAPISAEEARPWVETIERLFDDPAEYARACQRAFEAGRSYREPIVAARYAKFFENVRRRDTPLIPRGGTISA